jgi:hypothetical protein
VRTAGALGGGAARGWAHIGVLAALTDGIMTVRPGSGATLPELPVGPWSRTLPNHACATAAPGRARRTAGPLTQLERVVT